MNKIRRDGQNWVLPDGRRLPVISGGDGPVDVERLHSLPEVVRRRLADDDRTLAATEIYGRRGRQFCDVRRSTRFEVRTNDDGTVSIGGYATTWDTWYEVAGGPPYGWSESIARGAATKTLQMRDDVRFLFDHEGIPMGRNKSSTMTLTADDIGLLFDLPNLDVQRNVFAAALASAIERGDVDQMSMAFRAIRQEWNDDYTERRILELQLFDVSGVTYPANEATIIALRDARTDTVEVDEQRQTVTYPLSLALAEVDTLR